MPTEIHSIFHKSKAYWALFIAGFISLTLIFLQPVPRFNYDFEQFFPSDDPGLAFYRDYSEKFGNDNDYLLIALQNPAGAISDPLFLEQAFQVQTQIQALAQVDTVVSILNLQKPIIGLFGMRSVKILNWEDSLSSQNIPNTLDAYRSRLVSKDGKSLLLLIQNEQKISKEEGDLLYTEIKKVFEKNRLQPVATAGKIQVQGDFVNLMQDEFGLFLGLSFLLMIGILGLIFRSWWGVLLPVFVLGVGVVWAIGWMLVLGKPLDIMSVMQPTILLIVGMSAIIHFLSHLNKKMREGVPKDLAIKSVFDELWLAVFLTFLTTAFGFLSLYFTSIPALRDFGFKTGLGVLIMFGAVIMILPGLLFLTPILRPKTESRLVSQEFLGALLLFVFKRSKWIVVSFVGITLIAVFLAFQLKINGFLLDNLPTDHPIQQDFTFFDRQFGGSNPFEISIKTGSKASSLLDYEVLLELQKLENEVERIFGTAQILSPVTWVKLLNQGLNQGNEKAFKFPSLGQYNRMKRLLSGSSNKFTANYMTPDQKEGRLSARATDLGSDLMEKKRIELDVYVQKNINPLLLNVKWTGTAYLIDRGHASVSEQMAKGLIVAFILVGMIAGFLFRSWKISIIMLIPNLIPLIWMLGLMYILGIDFKLTTAILFTVAFGIAVDDSIHFMTRLRMELLKGKNLVYAIKRTFYEAGAAIILTSVILVSGFGLLIFSQFGVTHFTGVLIAFSLIFALLADLLLLPILILSLRKILEPFIFVDLNH